MNLQTSNQNANERDFFSGIDESFKSAGFSDTYSDILKPMPFWKMMKKINKTMYQLFHAVPVELNMFP